MSVYRQTASLISKVLLNNKSQLLKTDVRYIKRWVAPTLFLLNRRRKLIGPEPEKPRSSYLEWNYEAELFAFGKRLGEEFNPDILKRALIQKDYANLREINAQEKGIELTGNVHNHDLIEEGDKLIKDYIRHEYGKVYVEEIVNSIEKHLTSEDMLAHVAKHIGLTDLIKTNELPIDKLTLSNTFKAIVAAVHQSADIDRANKFIKDILIAQMVGKDVYEIWDPEKPYDYLQNLAKQKGFQELEPRLCNQSAVNTILANYQVGIYSNRKLLGIGWGETVQNAKETAAIDAIQRIHKQR